ncbi:hypothetical protein H0H81_005871 [Sphagnurus paluster]|uniref:C2H2-type domain-containing protein n=1 Tax=Sphagnurus paluster TaxID=117069 RepID=A0A9P7K772_9AGAR|nr:hypothetical protein H0H81_005871 [Sphagnurus paluster]
MSVGRPNIQVNSVIDEERYEANRAAIQQAQALVDQYSAMNEAAKQAYQKQQELLRKIEEGKEAERQLLALSGATASAPLAITGPPQAQQTSTQQWQQPHAQTSTSAQPQTYHGSTTHYNTTHVPAPHPHWSAYGSQMPNTYDYYSQNARTSYHGHTYSNIPPQQSAQRYQQVPQSARSTSAATPSTRAPLHYQTDPRIPQAVNSRGASTSARQTVSSRQALAMQPIVQQPQSNQAQVYPPPVKAPTPAQPRPKPTAAAQSTSQAHTGYTPAVAMSAVPNVVSQGYPHTEPLKTDLAATAARLHNQLMASTSGSSSSSSTPDPQTSTSRPMPSSLAAPTQSSSKPVASSAPAPAHSSSVSDNKFSSGATITIPNTGNYVDPTTYMWQLAYQPGAVERLKAFANAWSATVPNRSSLTLHNSSIKIYKDVEGTLSLVFPDPSKPANYSYVPIAKLQPLNNHKPAANTATAKPTHNMPVAPPMSTPAVPPPVQGATPAILPAKIVRQVYQDDQGNFQFLSEPLTSEQKKKFKAYHVQPQAVPPPQIDQTSSFRINMASNKGTATAHSSALTMVGSTTGPSANSSSFLSTSGTSLRTPAQANKKTIARDILRVLNPSSPWLKRSQPMATPAVHPLEPPAKRHALGQGSRPSSPVHQEKAQQEEQEQSLSKTSGVVLPPPSEPSRQPSSNLPAVADHPMKAQAEREEQEPVSKTDDVNAYNRPEVEPQSARNQPAAGTSHYRPWVMDPSMGRPKPKLPNTEPDPILADVSAPPPSSSPPATSNPPSDAIITSPPPQPPKSPSSSAQGDAPANIPSTSSRQQTPLFLPSPVSTPPPMTTAPVVEQLMNNLIIDDTPRTTQRKPKVQPFYVLVPPQPDYVRRYKAQQRKKRRSLSSTSTSIVEVDRHGREVEIQTPASSVDRDEDFDEVDTDPANGFANGEVEREAVRLSCSRVTKRECKWNGCEAILSSAEKLIQHLAFAHRRPRTFKGLCVCMWQQCGRHEASTAQLFQHLKTHATVPLLCAYLDCQESFRTPRQLAKHHRVEHRDTTLKPSAAIFVPTLEPLQEAPKTVASYLLEPAQPASISRDRHFALGPWVLRNIAGPVNLGTKRYNAASKPIQSGEGQNRVLGRQPYDFLTFPSTNYSMTPSQPSRLRKMENLANWEVSEMVQQGMVLWHPDEHQVKVEGFDGSDNELSLSGGGPEVAVDDEANHSHNEEAVEIMLSIP